jgi:hypothetical protein
LATSSNSIFGLEGERPLSNPDVMHKHYCNEPVSSATVTYNHPLVKFKFPLLNVFSLLYPQTQKNEIIVCLKYGIALASQSAL